ncbi:hypothetical protein [Gordonia soli]|uniref:Uncharacterized protein n=1 Tax=Gordonia soli NBRC 108243 TaxID=1223545 RepID=M0QKI4_9ACTN|nr:hypothetical protein [Gordonia soli]GAC68791.1 hypothetical protein GS4_18_00790 [Gordonia soli NBRC 108243]
MDVDVERVFALASATAGHALTLKNQKPLAGGTNANKGSGTSEVTRSLADAAKALDRVLEYHVRRLDDLSAKAVRGGELYQETEARNAERLATGHN